MGTQHCTGKAARVCRRQCSNSLPTNAATVYQQMQQPVYQQMHHVTRMHQTFVTRMHQTFHKVAGVTSACVNELGTLGKLYMEHMEYRLQHYIEYRLQHPVYTLAFQKIKSASTCVCVACGAWCLVRTCGVCVCVFVCVCVYEYVRVRVYAVRVCVQKGPRTCVKPHHCKLLCETASLQTLV